VAAPAASIAVPPLSTGLHSENPRPAGSEFTSSIRQSERGSYTPRAGLDSVADAEAFAEAAWIVSQSGTPVLCGLGVRLP
jgi:hypothetical protein